ncbi:hypothetical protein P3339_03250 [Microbulbifer sp. MLAF003]|uniref:hypothetical protein n=1 Tax=Microbulbifer sp. MLAF003 TaxID=3032582 RepID=UPI0024AE2ADA|nr:hypothetical protein [Microbulbifer sp. MLAF003]WHI51861.1 hypothetical protein P3339_03250 [Microbulbifer sp. MLAF003]
MYSHNPQRQTLFEFFERHLLLEKDFQPSFCSGEASRSILIDGDLVPNLLTDRRVK